MRSPRFIATDIPGLFEVAPLIEDPPEGMMSTREYRNSYYCGKGVPSVGRWPEPPLCLEPGCGKETRRKDGDWRRCTACGALLRVHLVRADNVNGMAQWRAWRACDVPLTLGAAGCGGGCVFWGWGIGWGHDDQGDAEPTARKICAGIRPQWRERHAGRDRCRLFGKDGRGSGQSFVIGC